MSMPIITGSDIKRCQAITDIIESVALQQTGLSHILNAEGEKIQAVLAIADNTDELLAVNTSVESMVNSITRLEVILQGKLDLFKDCICDSCDTETKVTTTLVLGDDTDSSLSEIATNTYIFVPGTKDNKITFTTDPESTITLLTTLPDNITFIDNTLYYYAESATKETVEIKLQIGDDPTNIVTIFVSYN